MALSYILQKVDNSGPMAAGFSMEGQKVTDSYYIQPEVTGESEPYTYTPVPELLEEVITDTLGYSTPAGDGSIDRTLPRAHPTFPWCYASSITRLVGVGRKDLNDNSADLYPANPELEAEPITDSYWGHVWYQMDVEFHSRPYAVLSNDAVEVGTVNWYDYDGTLYSDTYAAEWVRYTEFDYEPAPEVAFAQQGMMVFWTATAAAPNDYTYSGFPRMIIPKASIRFRWYQVPQSYLLSASSYLVEFIGRINQTAWYGWDEGQLLYLGLRVIRKYTPPVPDLIDEGEVSNYSTEKLCDLELLFEETARYQSDVPADEDLGNANFLATGHNLLPFLGDKDFYYAVSSYDDETPTYFSAPFELLFTDPDVLT